MQKFSLAVAKIEMCRKETESFVTGATGTAFFYKTELEVFLITNWHNVTGINPLTGNLLHSKNLTPNIIRIHYKKWVDQTKSSVQSQHYDLPLYNNDEPVWLEHANRNGVDVVAIPLSLDCFEDFANEFINTIAQETDLEVHAGMDCFILGFPEQLIGVANTPIWKRGSIASEPYQKHQYYYVDSATRKGMSGAPVIARHSGFLGGTGNVLTGNEKLGTFLKFIAIYSGRVGDDQLGFQLGTAWQTNVINEILTNRLQGKHPLIP